MLMHSLLIKEAVEDHDRPSSGKNMALTILIIQKY